MKALLPRKRLSCCSMKVGHMKQNLLIIGAGIYGVVALEIAGEMDCYDEIAFVDDGATQTPNGIPVIGKTVDLPTLGDRYTHAIVAIGNPEVRLSLLRKIKEETTLSVATLVSPRAYISPTAQVMEGSVIEPMAVVHTGVIIAGGCLISAGAVVNHAAMCCEGVHVDCNATVAGYTVVPAGKKIGSGEVFNERLTDPHHMFYSFET